MHSSERLGNLYVVATPIGNLEDITLRAIRILKEADIIACEDTRRTLKLLTNYNIHRKRLLSYHEHNEKKMSEKLVLELLSGKNIALVSDAGTPCISDPGYRVVRLARKKGIRVIPIPGPSAVISAISASGFPTDKFIFVGFLPRKESQLRETLKTLAQLPYTAVSYESPHRIERTLEVLSEVAPQKRISVYREITKVNEEFLEGTAKSVLKELLSKHKLKGECVILFYPSDNQSEEMDKSVDSLLIYLKEHGLSLKSAVKEVCQKTDLPRNQVYDRAIKLFNRN